MSKNANMIKYENTHGPYKYIKKSKDRFFNLESGFVVVTHLPTSNHDTPSHAKPSCEGATLILQEGLQWDHSILQAGSHEE